MQVVYTNLPSSAFVESSCSLTFKARSVAIAMMMAFVRCCGLSKNGTRNYARGFHILSGNKETANDVTFWRKSALSCFV